MPTEKNTAQAEANILLVDDNPANLLALETVLADLGHNLVKAASGAEALRLLLERDFAVVLLNVCMHDLDGFETAKRIRGGERSRHTPIIFLTAQESDEFSATQAYQLGAVDYLIEPLVPEIVRAKVAGFVDLFLEKERVKRQTEQLRLLIEGARDYAIFMLDLDGRIITWNSGAERIKGYRADEIIGQHFSRFYPQEAIDRAWPAEVLKRARAEGRYEEEGWRLRKDGSRFWANVVITALKDRAGTLVGFGKVTRDLTEHKHRDEAVQQFHRDLEQRVRERTAALASSNEALQTEIAERKRVEAALRDSEEQFHLLADSIPQLAWSAAPDGHIYWYNKRWYEYTGTTLEQMKGWGWQSVHDPNELPSVLERWRASIASGEPFDMVFPLRGFDGRFRPFLTRVMPLRGADGRILRWFGTNTDITAIREMEEALKEADRHKDQFLSMLAHELRNPLAPIRNGLQILKTTAINRETIEKARGMMERHVVHLARIVDDLLDVSRLTTGKFGLRSERLDLARLLRVIVDDHNTALLEAGLTAEVEVPEVPVWVQGDATRLTQVVGNLLQNAVKFTPRGGSVSVRLSTDAVRAQAVLAIRDTGVGIATDMLPRLFEPFEQADRSLDRGKGGLGLGLALVKGLVELHGGQVYAASDPSGRGAEFVVRLPMLAEPSAVAELSSTPIRAAKRLRILVVEDNRDSADSLRMLLELFGYEVAVAYSGPSGVEAAKAWRPDVVLCDIGLPGLDGYGVVGELRRNPDTAKARMIAVTGYGADEDRRKSQEAGFDLHLTKPVDPVALQEMVGVSSEADRASPPN
jgi:PAS domain S-box-containing protein